MIALVSIIPWQCEQEAQVATLPLLRSNQLWPLDRLCDSPNLDTAGRGGARRERCGERGIYNSLTR